MIEVQSLAAVRALRRGCGFENLVVLQRVDSTNSLARRILERCWTKGEQCPEVAIIARQQTAGRGRSGNSWVSDENLGIYVTIVRFVPRVELQTLPLLVGIGLGRALHRLGCEAGLKWPNDLLVGGRKLGGILIETVGRGLGDVAAIIGFGVNHGHDQQRLPTEKATSLRLEIDPLPGLATVAAALLRGVREELMHLGEVRYARDAYESMSVHRAGDRLRCRMGREPVEGTFLGFDGHGFLRLEVSGEERVLSCGEILE